MELAMVIGGLRAEFIPLVSFLVRLPIPVIQHAIAVFARLRKYGQVGVSYSTEFPQVLIVAS